MSDLKDPLLTNPLPEPGGSNKMLMVFLLIGGIGIGAGGFFALDMFTAKPDGAVEEHVEEVAAEPEPEPKKEDFSYVEIKRMPATIVNSDGSVMGYVFLDLKIEVLTSKDPGYVQQRLPRIQAEMLKDISQHGVSVPGKPGVIDYEGLSKRLKEAANRAVDGDRVSEVFVFRAIRS